MLHDKGRAGVLRPTYTELRNDDTKVRQIIRQWQSILERIRICL